MCGRSAADRDLLSMPPGRNNGRAHLPGDVALVDDDVHVTGHVPGLQHDPAHASDRRVATAAGTCANFTAPSAVVASLMKGAHIGKLDRGDVYAFLIDDPQSYAARNFAPHHAVSQDCLENHRLSLRPGRRLISFSLHRSRDSPQCPASAGAVHASEVSRRAQSESSFMSKP